MTTRILPISDLRRQASEIINSVQETRDAVYITQHGRPAAVLVNYEQYEQMLQDLEDLTDRLSLESAAKAPLYLYPTVALPASSLEAWTKLLDEGYGGDALADTEALYDEV